MSLFGLVREWKERRQALRELGNMERVELSVLAFDEGNFVHRAKVAVDVGDLSAAAHYWEEALRRYPSFAKWDENALSILLGLGRYDEAEALVLEGIRKGHHPMRCAESYAEIAQHGGDVHEAIRRWAEVRRKYPSSSKAYVQGVNCLIRVGDAEAAEKLAQKCTRRFPKVHSAWMERARVAELREDWPEALRRWEMADKRFNNTIVHIGIARSLTELGRFEEADARLVEAQRREPVSHVIALEQVRVARQKGDNDEEVRRWADIRRRFPAMRFSFHDSFRRLLDMGRVAEAEEVLVAAIDQFPQEPWPAEEYAEIATRQQDWAAAETRWAAVRAKWPDREKAYRLGAEALTRLGREDEAKQLQNSLNEQRKGG